jgi:hypothetical protein
MELIDASDLKDEPSTQNMINLVINYYFKE